jgi:aryl-alcohol dehydrogenase-like predicted oxidoreductase
MGTRVLGRSGIQVSAVGMGCWAMGGPWQFVEGDGTTIPAGWGAVDDKESIGAVHAAIDAGVTLFDTAANYGAGHSERILGRALAGTRDDVVIATKFGFLVDEEARVVRTDDERVIANVAADCEASLRRLDTDRIDLYQLHVGSLDPTRAAEVRDALEGLVAEGKIRAYGWSTDDAERAAVFAEGEHCATVQFAYNVFSQKYAVRDLLVSADLGGLARSPLAMAILTGKFSPDTTFAADDVRQQMNFTEGRHAEILSWGEEMRATLTGGGHTTAQGALAWILTSDERIIPIPGARTAAQVMENAATLDKGPLSLDQMVAIEGYRAARIDTVQAYYNPHPPETGPDAA